MSAENGPKAKPWELRRFTLAEICLAIEDASPKPEEGRAINNREDLMRYREWLLSLRPAEKLALARQGKL